jgi:hypothetical protein
MEAVGEAIPGAVATLPAAGEIIGKAGRGAQSAAEATVGSGVVGARLKDVRRGANPGKGYFQSGRGPSLSMGGIANRAQAGMDVTGAALQKTYSAADASGERIPVQAVRDALQSTIGEARTAMEAPGGTGDTDALTRFEGTFEPALRAAEEHGGFLPSELWKIRRNIDRHTTWGDPAKANMTKVQQQTSGALGGVLEDAVPETVPLNSTYQNQTALYARAAERAATGQSTARGLLTKGALGTAGAVLGSHGGTAEGALLGLGAVAADSVPVKTTGAALVHGAGELAEGAGKIADKVPNPVAEGLAGAAAATPKQDQDEDFPVTQTGPNTWTGPTVELAPAVGANNVLSSGTPVSGASSTPIVGGAESEQPQQVEATDDNGGDQTVDQGAPRPQAELYTPQTHNFSPTQWAAANPDGNPDEARAEAERQGYELVA